MHADGSRPNEPDTSPSHGGPLMNATLWAAFAWTPRYDTASLTLHTTYRDALLAVARYLRGDNRAAQRQLSDKVLERLADNALNAKLTNFVTNSGDDDEWYIQECQLPEHFALLPALLSVLRQFVLFGQCRQSTAHERRALAAHYARLARGALRIFPSLRLNQHTITKTDEERALLAQLERTR